ncbi:hypothetical protein BK025_15120 [Sodalis sp. TME1]|nr:hypothetical protein BK025_15120 [Sodalis sp. TME1]
MIFAAGVGKLVVPMRAMVILLGGDRVFFAFLVHRLVSLAAARIANLISVAARAQSVAYVRQGRRKKYVLL